MPRRETALKVKSRELLRREAAYRDKAREVAFRREAALKVRSRELLRREDVPRGKAREAAFRQGAALRGKVRGIIRREAAHRDREQVVRREDVPRDKVREIPQAVLTKSVEMKAAAEQGNSARDAPQTEEETDFKTVQGMTEKIFVDSVILKTGVISAIPETPEIPETTGIPETTETPEIPGTPGINGVTTEENRRYLFRLLRSQSKNPAVLRQRMLIRKRITKIRRATTGFQRARKGKISIHSRKW